MKENNCAVCGNTFNNSLYRPKEMMFGFEDEFEYFKCSKCGCLQISEVPQNLQKFYPTNYYSYSNLSKDHYYSRIVKAGVFEKIKGFVKKSIVLHRLGQKNSLGSFLSPYYKSFYWIIEGIFRIDSKILDIGCGNGNLLLELSKLGCTNLNGLDPFIEEDIYYPNGVKIFKKEILDIDENYDFIMLNHSFEHLENPKIILQKIFDCLNPGAFVLIRIPVASSYAFRKYGIHWVQLDAPRHFFLHTPTSINRLAEDTGFKVVKTIYDSTSLQFVGSEGYVNNIPLKDMDNVFSGKQIKLFEKEAKRLNEIHDGDSACFYLYKD
jgi:SAM-dependent methyltransferase